MEGGWTPDWYVKSTVIMRVSHRLIEQVFDIEMSFFSSSVTALKTVVTAIGAGVAVWGIINLLEGYGNDNPGAKSQGIKHVIPNSLEQ